MTFTDIIDKYTRGIRAKISRILTDESDIADCYQDVLVALALAYGDGTLPTGPTQTNYVMQTARNVALNFKSSNIRRTSVISSSIDAPRPGETEPTYDSELFGDVSPVTSTPATREVAAAAESLPILLREVIIYRYYRDWNIPEIAIHLNVSEVVIRKRLSRAIALLKNTFVIGHKRIA